MKRSAGLVLQYALRIRGGEERESWWYALYRSSDVYFSARRCVVGGKRGRERRERREDVLWVV